MRRSALRIALALAVFGLALAAGYHVSSHAGRERLRVEAEQQLARIFDSPARVGAVRLQLLLPIGIEIIGEDVQIESSDGSGRTVLGARSVVAGLDTDALLLGRFRIDRLEIDGLSFTLSRDEIGRWDPGWVGSKGHQPRGLEEKIEIFADLASDAHFLLSDGPLPPRILLTDATLDFSDRHPTKARDKPIELRLEGASASLERGWWGQGAEVWLRGTIRDPQGGGTPAELHAKRIDEDVELKIAANGLPIDSVSGYLGSATSLLDFDGALTGVVAMTSSDPEHADFELDWVISDFAAVLPLGDTSGRVEAPHATLAADIGLRPDEFRVDRAVLRLEPLELRLAGKAERPLRLEAPADVDGEVEGLTLVQLQRLAAGLPRADRETVEALLERVDSGVIVKARASGHASLEALGLLLAGDSRRLPPGFDLSAELEGVTFGANEQERLEDLSTIASWNGDIFELRGTTARFNGAELPKIDLAVVGVAQLLTGIREEDPLTRTAATLPGLGTLWDLVRGPAPEAGATQMQAPPIEVEVHELQHPALRWPLRDALIFIDPSRRDLHVSISRAYWAGSLVQGDAVLGRGPERALRIELRVDPRQQPNDEGLHVIPGQVPDFDETLWAYGTFRSSGVHGGPLRFASIEGDFSLQRQTLLLNDVEATLEAGGTLRGDASFALHAKGEVLAATDATIADADAGRVAQLFGLPANFATGRADVRGQLAGPLRPESLLIGGLVGEIDIAARDGAVRQSVPLLAALAHASEGLSPFSATEQLVYERIDARFAFEHGRISTERFALEGPLRVLASGAIDFNPEPAPIDATVGVFILRQADLLLGDLPLVRLLIPGSDRGLIGAYFEVSGPVVDPDLRTMPMKSLAEGVPLPEVLRSPFESLRGLFAGRTRARRGTN